MKSKKFLTILFIIFACFAYLIPFVLASQKVLSGDIPFWYDPARDFLSAWDNLQKLTLIGPTSGIPGIFYGPYWIWLLSFGLLFSKDPQTVIFLVVTLPYFILLPLILWNMRKLFDVVIIIILWLLFMLSTGFTYATSPWNPYPAPLLLMLMIYIVVNTDFLKKGRQKLVSTFAIGALCGLILNFHISFGLGVATGTFLFLFTYLGDYAFRKKAFKDTGKSYVLFLCSFAAGVFLAFLPFFLFEVRHGFNQIQTMIKVFTTQGSVVTLKGLDDSLIIQNFFETAAKLLQISYVYSSILLATGVIYLVYGKIKKHLTFTHQEIKLLALITTIMCSVLFLYLTSKNPVWSYHFIGVEILFLLLIGLVIKKSQLLRIALLIWVVCIASLQIPTIIISLTQEKKLGGSLAGEKQIVQTIHQDADGKAYAVFAYSPSIYTYEYSYLFKWLAQKDVPYDPGSNTQNAETIYIITPLKQDSNVIDFINYRASKTKYKNVKTWQLFNDTTIMKMKRI